VKILILLTVLVVLILFHYSRQSIKRSENINGGDLVFSHKVGVIRRATASDCYIWIYETKLSVSSCDTWKAGDTVTITGKVEYANAKDYSIQKILIKDVKVAKKNAEVSLNTRLANLVNIVSFWFYFRSQEIFSYLGKEDGGLIFGLVFGQALQVSSSFKEQIRSAGLPYLLSVSSFAFNLTIHSSSVYAKYFPYRKKELEIISLFTGTLYVILVGYPVALQRVVVASLIDYSSTRIFYRPILPLYRLLLSSLLILMWNPFAIQDISFQFSVLAAIALNLFRKVPHCLEVCFFFLAKNQRKRVAQLIWVPIAVQILTSPLVFYYFGEIQLLSPISNLCISWILPVILVLGVSYWLIGQLFIPIVPYITPLIKGPILVFNAEISWLARLAFPIHYKPSLENMVLGYCLITLFIIGSRIYHKRYLRQSNSYGY
jgi:ComEC/Rec2-related protein